MAKIIFEGLGEYRSRLLDLGANLNGMIKASIYPAAGVLADAIREATPVDMGKYSESKGDLQKSVSIANFESKDGTTYTGVYFAGYDSKGVPNALIARTLESGRHKEYKHPFVRKTVNRVKQQCSQIMEKELDEQIDKEMNKDLSF